LLKKFDSLFVTVNLSLSGQLPALRKFSIYNAFVTMPDNQKLLATKALNARRNILRMIYSAQASHLGSSMSVVEMLVAMYSVADISKILERSDSRDRIIVSKGHAAAGTYAVMHEFGLMTEETLFTYHKLNSKLQGHVSHGVEFVEHSTGALGHGLSVGVGHAAYLKSKKLLSRVLVLCGDGEIQEGSIWEALMLASTKELNQLILLVDTNGISSIKETEEIINTGDLKDRFSGFGLRVIEVDGHNAFEIQKAIFTSSDGTSPLVIICKTIKGKGVSFAENQPIWHYRSLNEELFTEAMEHLK
jgi:transketolase